ncbi:2-C-methyl-D-erythritol 4-phosphate cytidylyltransferase [Alteromonadales bacterium alter-6D02]|nr:2-C-methyl-D-erythritol 4-phosphate cytidylyltransferase [Alteromonadales bacterium alter-6D02]
MPAAGVGKRMGSDIPKQYLQIAKKAIIEYSLEPLLACSEVESVVIALSENDDWFSALAIASHPKIQCVVGGGERADSVLSALKSLSEQGRVLVHDAARPCLTTGDVDALLAAQTAEHGAILASQVRDTMKRGKADGTISTTVERENLFHALTPQLFDLASLRKALSNALTQGVTITDEASAMEWAGYTVKLVAGRSDNIKVTRAEDLQLATLFLTQQQRINQG